VVLICENCGAIAKEVSIRDFCVDCEWRIAKRQEKEIQELKEEISEFKEIFEQVPEAYRVPTRLCKECMYGDFDALGVEMACLKRQRPRFIQPKSGDFTSGLWGYQKKCSVFKRRPKL
jgi:hypothetical protein